MVMKRDKKDKRHAFLQKQLERIVTETVQAYTANKGPTFSYIPKVALISPSHVLPLGGNVPYFLREMIGDDPLWRERVMESRVSH